MYNTAVANANKAPPAPTGPDNAKLEFDGHNEKVWARRRLGKWAPTAELLSPEDNAQVMKTTPSICYTTFIAKQDLSFKGINWSLFFLVLRKLMIFLVTYLQDGKNCGLN